MNVLVTGGAGYIGSHTAKALKLSGHNPITVDNLIYGHKWAVKWGPLHILDIREQEKLTALLVKEKIEAVVHFAAFAFVGESMQDPLKYYNNNIGGTISLLNAMAAANVSKIVFSSSCATYGAPETLPITEETEQKPINPYGQSKYICEQMFLNLARAQKLEAIALRYFNAAGADASGEIGEDHTPETHLIPLAIAAAFSDSKPLSIFGRDYSTPDGTCVREYIHVTDLADAHVKALEFFASGQMPTPRFLALNLGTENGASVLEIIKSVEKVSGRKVKILSGPRRPGDPATLVANRKKAERILGWVPQHSSLDNIVLTALNWFEGHELKK